MLNICEVANGSKDTNNPKIYCCGGGGVGSFACSLHLLKTDMS